MKIKLFILIFILVIFWACESPMAPKIEEILEESNPKAIIDFSVSPNPIHFQKYGQFVIILTERNNVLATVSWIGIGIKFKYPLDEPIYYSTKNDFSLKVTNSHIDISDRIIPANGQLNISCCLWIPSAEEPTLVKIAIHGRDANGHEFSASHGIKATGIGS